MEDKITVFGWIATIFLTPALYSWIFHILLDLDFVQSADSSGEVFHEWQYVKRLYTHKNRLPKPSSVAPKPASTTPNTGSRLRDSNWL